MKILIRYLDILQIVWYLIIRSKGGDYMKEHHKHHHHDNSLTSLFDRCGHILAHHFGNRGRGQEGILEVIHTKSGITQKELAEVLNIQPASVSELLMKLERKSMVIREKDIADRRSIRVFLSEEGEKMIQQPKEAPADPFQALSDEEQEQLRILLEKLLTDWKQRYPMDRHHHKHHHE